MRSRALVLLASVILTGVIVFLGGFVRSAIIGGGSPRSTDPTAGSSASTGSIASSDGPAAKVPKFDLPDLQTDSIRYNLAGFAGKPLVINVFDYTCVPCIRELPMISATAKSNPDVAFLGVHLLLQRNDAQDFVRNLKLSFPVAYDGEGTFATSVLALPTTIFLDRSGREVARVTGPISKDDLADRLQRLR